MRIKFLVLFVCMLSLVATPVYAREPVPLVNHNNVAITSKPLTVDQVKGAILTGAVTAGWSSIPQENNLIVSTLTVRNKHTVVVEISYTAQQFSINYKSSTNMKAGLSMDKQQMIHPFYNNWVDSLKNAIQAELHKY
ncbi:MAG: hypothetical protein HQM05_12010 [Magnetococcales bacterium]|nr:hypothetical protein [Magnetococcales bacterium]